MRSRRVLHTVESHTEGMPTRVVTGGVGVIPGDTMFDRRRWFMANSEIAAVAGRVLSAGT